MKTKVILTLCVVFVLALAANANAQLVSGSAEEKAFTKIEGEQNNDAKIALLLEFEKTYPQSRVLPDIYSMLMTIYQGKNEFAKVIDFGERAIKIDGENLTALLAVSRNLAIERKQIDKAISYAQKAVDTVAKLRSQPAPPQYSTEDQWKGYLDSMDQASKSMLAYAKSLK
jgi:tetratricopeptide (TPR) repeat protein